MEIVDVVSDLLFKNNCVIIPGIGGFVANYTQAEIKKDSHTLIPSRKKIAFNQSLTDNDGLLVSRVSKVNNITYSEAEKEIELFTAFVRNKVINNKSFEFKNIGTFYLNKDENLVFVPYEGLNMLTASYGLAPIKVRPLFRTDKTAVEEKKLPEPETTKTQSAIQTQTEAAAHSNKLWHKIWPWAGAAVFISVMALAYQFLGKSEFPQQLTMHDTSVENNNQNAGLFNFDSQSTQQTHTEKPVAEQTEIKTTPEVKISDNATETPMTKVEEKSEPVADNKEEKTNVAEPDWLTKWKALQQQKIYYITVFSSTKETAAQNRANELRNSKGVKSGVLNNKGNFMVFIEHFTDPANAAEYLKYIKRSYKEATITESIK